MPALISPRIALQLHDPQRLRRRHDPSPAPIRVLDQLPALVAATFRLVGVQEAADGLGRILERRVICGHLGLADDRGGLPVHAPPAELVVEVLLQCVADRALTVRSADVQRELVQFVRCELRAPQDEAHLWAVAMADGDVPAFLDHPDDVPACLLCRDVLVAHGLVLLVLDERVATDRDDRGSRRRHGTCLLPYSTAPRIRASRDIRITTPLNASTQ